MPGWPNPPAARLVWVRGGAEEEGSSGPQAGGAGRSPGEPWLQAPLFRDMDLRELPQGTQHSTCPSMQGASYLSTCPTVRERGQSRVVSLSLRPVLEATTAAQGYAPAWAGPGNVDLDPELGRAPCHSEPQFPCLPRGDDETRVLQGRAAWDGEALRPRYPACPRPLQELGRAMSPSAPSPHQPNPSFLSF